MKLSLLFTLTKTLIHAESSQESGCVGIAERLQRWENNMQGNIVQQSIKKQFTKKKMNKWGFIFSVQINEWKYVLHI